MEKKVTTQSMIDEAWEKQRRYNILSISAQCVESKCMFVMTT